MIEPTDLGKAIQKLRGERTQKECAERARISPSSWSLYEAGERAPRKAMRERISRGLEVEASVLEEAAWEVRKKRLDVAQAGEKDAVAGGDTARDPVLHAIDEHVNGVARHLREIAILLRTS